jgi:acid stress-induced BolA-like protein IbaG/YrbA
LVEQQKLGKSRTLGEIIMKDVITKILSEGIKYNKLLVEGSESKYEVQIVSDIFENKSTIQRHKMIYALLDSYIKTGEIHALTIKAMTPGESEK